MSDKFKVGDRVSSKWQSEEYWPRAVYEILEVDPVCNFWAVPPSGYLVRVRQVGGAFETIFSNAGLELVP